MPPKERGGEKVHTHTHTHTRLQQRGPALGIITLEHTHEGGSLIPIVYLVVRFL